MSVPKTSGFALLLQTRSRSQKGGLRNAIQRFVARLFAWEEVTAPGIAAGRSSKRSGRWVRAAAILVLFLTLDHRAPAQATADSSPAAGYQQKASLICNFLRNCKWPDRRFARPDAPFVIGIYGNDQISEYLRENIRDRLIQGRSVQIWRITHREELAVCHLVFVSRSERDRLRTVLGDTRRENVLTVGESDNFLANGGVIQFTNAGGQVRYQLSLDAARRERIEPNGFVLRMAMPQSSVSRTQEQRLAVSPTPRSAE